MPSVRRVLKAHAPYRTVDDREDMLQDVCLKAYRSHKVVEPMVFVSYCCRIAQRICLDANRRDSCRVKIFPLVESGELTVLDVEPCARPNALDVILDEESQRETLARFDHMTNLQREALLLRAEGLSYEEIGAIQGVSAGAVRSRISRVREFAKSGARKEA